MHHYIRISKRTICDFFSVNLICHISTLLSNYITMYYSEMILVIHSSDFAVFVVLQGRSVCRLMGDWNYIKAISHTHKALLAVPGATFGTKFFCLIKWDMVDKEYEKVDVDNCHIQSIFQPTLLFLLIYNYYQFMDNNLLEIHVLTHDS